MAEVTVGSLPGTVNLTGRRGDKWGPFQFTPRTDLDLSGRTWVAQVRATKDRPAEVLATITVDAADADEGVIRVSLLPAQSGLLATGPDATPDGVSPTFQPGKATYWWDIQATKDDDATDVKTWFGGKVLVDGDVSEDDA